MANSSPSQRSRSRLHDFLAIDQGKEGLGCAPSHRMGGEAAEGYVTPSTGTRRLARLHLGFPRRGRNRSKNACSDCKAYWPTGLRSVGGLVTGARRRAHLQTAPLDPVPPVVRLFLYLPNQAAVISRSGPDRSELAPAIIRSLPDRSDQNAVMSPSGPERSELAPVINRSQPDRSHQNAVASRSGPCWSSSSECPSSDRAIGLGASAVGAFRAWSRPTKGPAGNTPWTKMAPRLAPTSIATPKRRRHFGHGENVRSSTAASFNRSFAKSRRQALARPEPVHRRRDFANKPDCYRPLESPGFAPGVGGATIRPPDVDFGMTGFLG